MEVIWTETVTQLAQNTTPATITLPEGLQDGDMAFVALAYQQSITTRATAEGWVYEHQVDVGSYLSSFHSKTLRESDSGTTHQFAANLSARKSLSIVIVRGATMDKSALWTNATSSVTGTIPAVDANEENMQLALLVGEDNFDSTAPAGWTELTESPTNSTTYPMRSEIWLGPNGSFSSQSFTGTRAGGKSVWRVSLARVIPFFRGWGLPAL